MNSKNYTTRHLQHCFWLLIVSQLAESAAWTVWLTLQSGQWALGHLNYSSNNICCYNLTRFCWNCFYVPFLCIKNRFKKNPKTNIKQWTVLSTCFITGKNSHSDWTFSHTLPLNSAIKLPSSCSLARADFFFTPPIFFFFFPRRNFIKLYRALLWRAEERRERRKK